MTWHTARKWRCRVGFRERERPRLAARAQSSQEACCHCRCTSFAVSWGPSRLAVHTAAWLATLPSLGRASLHLHSPDQSIGRVPRGGPAPAKCPSCQASGGTSAVPPHPDTSLVLVAAFSLPKVWPLMFQETLSPTSTRTPVSI